MEEILQIAREWGPSGVFALTTLLLVWYVVFDKIKPSASRGPSAEQLSNLSKDMEELTDELQKITNLIAQIQVKVDTMWEFTLRRGKIEALNAGIADMNSPIVLNDRAKELIAPLVHELVALYNELKPIDDTSLAIAIERRFGEEIFSYVCAPAKVHLGACLVLANAAAKGELDNPLH